MATSDDLSADEQVRARGDAPAPAIIRSEREAMARRKRRYLRQQRAEAVSGGDATS